MEMATASATAVTNDNALICANLSELLQYDLCYVASPYTSYPAGVDRAYSDVGDVSWWLRLAGISHFSPILYAHPLAKVWGVDRGNSAFWLDFDSSMMDVCDAMVIVDLDGWADSHGIGIEQAIFEKAGKPIYHLDPITLELHRE